MPKLASGPRLEPSWTRRDLLRLLPLGAVAVAGEWALSACGGPAKPTPNPTYAAGTLDVTSFGAKGDGRADDTAALHRAIGALRPHQTLLLPSGKTFRHTAVLTIATTAVRLTGGGTLLADDEQRSALAIAADDVTVESLTLAIRTTTQRWDAPDQNKLTIGAVRGAIIRDVAIRGSAAAGIFCHGASGFLLQRVSVQDTRADGIHMTDGAHNGTVDAPRISKSGDDAVAVVSYLSDKAFCHSITVTGPTVQTTTGGRGLSVVGGQDITYRSINVSGTSAAAVYVACEGSPYFTYPTSNVTVVGGRIAHANTDPKIDHGAVLIYSGRPGGSVSNITVRDLTITDTRSTATRQIGVVRDGDQQDVSGIVFSGLSLQRTPQPYQGNVPTGAVTLQNVTADGRTVAP